MCHDEKIALIFSLSGDDIYNTIGAGRTLRRKTRKDRVKYRTVSPTAANITAAVVAGTTTSGEMVSAEVEAIEMEIKPIRSRQKNWNGTYRHTAQFVAVGSALSKYDNISSEKFFFNPGKIT
jgi:hypothetical protein